LIPVKKVLTPQSPRRLGGRRQTSGFCGGGRERPSGRVPTSESLLSVVHALANMIVELAHKDGSIVRALMSRSALMRADDQFALAVFQDLTEQL
jgi:hypothetical protein